MSLYWKHVCMGLPIQCCCLGWRGREQNPNPPPPFSPLPPRPPWIHVRQPYLHPLYLQLYQPQTQTPHPHQEPHPAWLKHACAFLPWSLRATSESGCPHVHGLLWSELHLKSQTRVIRYGHRRAGPWASSSSNDISASRSFCLWLAHKMFGISLPKA